MEQYDIIDLPRKRILCLMSNTVYPIFGWVRNEGKMFTQGDKLYNSSNNLCVHGTCFCLLWFNWVVTKTDENLIDNECWLENEIKKSAKVKCVYYGWVLERVVECMLYTIIFISFYQKLFRFHQFNIVLSMLFPFWHMLFCEDF